MRLSWGCDKNYEKKERYKLGLSCAKLTVVWFGLKLSNELKIEDENVGDE